MIQSHPSASASLSTSHFSKARLPQKILLAMAAGLACFAAQADDALRNSGTKYSPLREINKSNVADLELAWTYNTGDLPTTPGLTSFQDTPMVVNDNLIVCSVTRKVIALDPTTGAERWVYDPQSPPSGSNKCRGVSSWVDETKQSNQQCHTRLILGTSDYRLIAIDANDGKPCEEFGDNGIVQMEASKPQIFPGEVSALSRPAIVNGVVVVGSSVMDNQRRDAPSGRVLAFDARTGESRWSFDPVPRDPEDPAVKTWEMGVPENGGANVWSGMVVDEELDMVYLPTSSPSLDFWGGDRPGDNLYTDSVVALRGATGEVAWHFQTVHHDVWDYDLPTPGLLIDYPHNGEMVPALVQNTKQGLIFIFNRETGEPLVPIEERPVPQEGAVAGEKLSPTQPFPVGMPTIAPQSFTPDQAWGFTPIDKWLCKNMAEDMLYGDIYTPPSAKGTIMMPSPSGGPDWGGGAYDPESNIMIAGVNTIAMIIKNTPREEANYDPTAPMDLANGFNFANKGIPYITNIKPFLSPLGAPCTEPPWAKLYAVDLVKKEIVWEVPLGSIEKLAPIPIPWELGTPAVGAPLVTAGGLAFIGYALDHKFRAFDLKTGETLWSAELPAPANSTPITYEVNGEQFIVVPAGGHSMFQSELSDTVMAYKLPKQ